MIVRGANVLTFDVAGLDAKGCVPYTVAGKSDIVCSNTAAESGAQAVVRHWPR